MKFINNTKNRNLLKELGYTLAPSIESSHHKIATYLMSTIDQFREETNGIFSCIDAIEFNNALRDNFLDERK